MPQFAKTAVLTVFAIVFVPGAQAQRPASAPQPANPSGPRVQVQTRQVVRTTSSHHAPSVTPVVTVASASRVETLLQGNFPVPGLGFDFPHHAAVNANLDVRALVDPVTQRRLALAREIQRESALVPVFPVVLPVAPVVVIPPVVIVQQAAPEVPQVQQIIERVRDAESAPETAAAPPPPPPAPVRELDALVFVRRDGTLAYAVAYSIRGDRVVYITPEGVRRSILLAEIDTDATEQLNEERGTSLRLRL